MCIFVDCLLCPLILWPTLIGVALYLIKYYMQGAQFTKPTNEEGKIVIVTGCNTGIGKETVLELAKRGATVYMACRDMKKCEQARSEIVRESHNSNIHARKCDLASLESIRKFATNFKLEQNQLHILINNAGAIQKDRLLTKDGFEMQMGVNHMGHFLLTHLLLDTLKASAPSRIINVSSMAHLYGKIKIHDLNSEKSYSEVEAYCQSKLANVLFTHELARRLDGTGVTTNSLHPGFVNTEFGNNSIWLQNSIVRWLLKSITWPIVRTPKSGAQTTLYAALDGDLAGVSGKYFDNCRLGKVSKAAKDEQMVKWLWTESEKWTRLHPEKFD